MAKKFEDNTSLHEEFPFEIVDAKSVVQKDLEYKHETPSLSVLQHRQENVDQRVAKKHSHQKLKKILKIVGIIIAGIALTAILIYAFLFVILLLGVLLYGWEEATKKR